MLSVLHVIARLPASGTERQLVGMLQAAHGRLWHAELCVLYPGFPLVDEVEQAGVRVHVLKGTSRVHRDRLAALRGTVSRGHFDVVHSSLWGGNAFARAAVGTLRRRPAVVISERRVEDFRARPARLLDAALRSLTDGYIGNSADVGRFIERAHRVPAERVDVIPNGLDATVFHPRGKTRAVEAPLRIGSVGRLVTQKGFDVLLAALPAVLEMRPVELVVAGEGEERAALERLAVGLPASFPGALSSPRDVADFLRTLDLFVLPSRYEGLPNVVLEARACGLPVVVTDVPGMAQATDGTARLVPAEDAAALAGAISAELDELPARGGGNVESAVVRDFDAVAVDHLAAFEKALQRARRATTTTTPGGAP